MSEKLDFVNRDFKTIAFTAAAAINASEIQLVGDTYVASYLTLENGAIGQGVYWSDCCQLPKAAAAFAVGDNLWLTPAGPLTLHPVDAGSDVKVGICIEPATDAATHVYAAFDGRGI